MKGGRKRGKQEKELTHKSQSTQETKGKHERESKHV